MVELSFWHGREVTLKRHILSPEGEIISTQVKLGRVEVHRLGKAREEYTLGNGEERRYWFIPSANGQESCEQYRLNANGPRRVRAEGHNTLVMYVSK